MLKTHLKRLLAPRRWFRGLSVLAVLVGVGGAVFAAWIVLDKARWFPEFAETASRLDDLETRVDLLESDVSAVEDQLGLKDTDELSTRIDDLESTQEALADRTEDLESRLDDVESDASDVDSRLGVVEADVEAASRQADEACSQIESATDFSYSC